MLFSFGGKAVKGKDGNAMSRYGGVVDVPKSHVSEAYVAAIPTDEPETAPQYKIVDYATLYAWYNENKAIAAADGAGTVNSEAPEYNKKQRALKFMML